MAEFFQSIPVEKMRSSVGYAEKFSFLILIKLLAVYVNSLEQFRLYNVPVLVKKRLKKYGIKIRLLNHKNRVYNNWCRLLISYQTTKNYNDAESGSVPINFGAPQGLLLGPLLFLIF